MQPPQFIAAIDQGTTSTRCILFRQDGSIASVGQFEHKQIFPQKGWVEHNPMEIWDNTRLAQAEALAKADASPENVVALGITNQRETTVVWDKRTGYPVYNAIVWQDTRTADMATEIAGEEGPDKWRHKTGLIINSYPAGPKIKWILDNVEGAREDAEAGHLLFGTMDTWLIWNLTGGAWGDHDEPALHVTDVTNASRTLLMNLETLEWDEEICQELGIPMQMFPEIRPSSGDFRHVRGRDALANVPIRGVLGDQQAAMFGQACFDAGDAKNTYGTGLFLLMNTGEEPKYSDHGMLTTVCYQIEGEKPVYALEGSVAIGGSLIQWLRDNLGIINEAPEVETLARKVPDNGGVYIVPAFSGLFAPRWRPDARGVFTGLTRFANKNHIARAAIEATAFQTREIAEAMVADSGKSMNHLKVDGGMVKNELLMQFQSDIMDQEVIRPKVIETTALGAAYAAGLAIGYWDSIDEVKSHWAEDKAWSPEMADDQRQYLVHEWNKAVERTYGWEDGSVDPQSLQDEAQKAAESNKDAEATQNLG